MPLPPFLPRRLAAVAGIACAAALIPVASLAATGTTASTPRCATSGLVVWANADYGGGYAGGYYYTISFTNLSGHACTLQGYPGGSAVSLTRHQLGSPAGWGSMKPRGGSPPNGGPPTPPPNTGGARPLSRPRPR